MFYKVDKSSIVKEADSGRVYLLKIWLADGDIVYKIGMCRGDRSTERMMEILVSFFSCYRYVPKCVLLRDRRCLEPVVVEKRLHELYHKFNLKFNKRFSGSTEFFQGINEVSLLEEFERIR